jgi:hypothetical protein
MTLTILTIPQTAYPSISRKKYSKKWIKQQADRNDLPGQNG